MGFFDRFFKKPAPEAGANKGDSRGRLIAATELAGFFAAHAVWCVSEGETLIPLAGFEDAKGQRAMNRFAAERIEQGVAAGEQWLKANPQAARRAAFIFDAFITLETGKTDALIVKVRDFAGGAAMTWAIPYRAAGAPGGFAVHRPKMLDRPAGDESEAVPLGEALWRGIAAHQKGSEVWNNHLDETR